MGGVGSRGDFLGCWECVVAGVLVCIGCFVVIWSFDVMGLLEVCSSFG